MVALEYMKLKKKEPEKTSGSRKKTFAVMLFLYYLYIKQKQQ